MSLSPAVVQPFVRKLTGNDNVALGHSGAVGFAIGGLVGMAVKGKKDIVSTEQINFPKGLGFLRDSTVSIALTMAVFYIIVALFAGPAYVESHLSNGKNYILFALLQAGLFSAGVFIILSGVRLVLAEIVPAFKGISSKIVPNSKPALDVPIVYTYAPNAVLIGFFSSFVGGDCQHAHSGFIRRDCYFTWGCPALLHRSSSRSVWKYHGRCAWRHFRRICERSAHQFHANSINTCIRGSRVSQRNLLRFRLRCSGGVLERAKPDGWKNDNDDRDRFGAAHYDFGKPEKAEKQCAINNTNEHYKKTRIRKRGQTL